MKSVTRRGHKTAHSTSDGVIRNRRASYDYALGDEITVGMELTGAEAKAARLSRVSLKGAYVVPKMNNHTGKMELFLINASFTLMTNAPRGSGEKPTTVDTRARRLLAKRREIDNLVEQRNSGKTIVPIRMLTRGRHVKLEIAAGKGKKQYDKRTAIRKRDDKREVAKLTKRYRI